MLRFPKSTVFLDVCSVPLRTLLYRNLALILQWLLELFDAEVGLR